MPRKRPKRRVAALLVLVLVAACASRKPGDPIKPGFNTLSPAQDVQLGRQAAAEIRQQVEVVRDTQLQGYVSALGAKLAAQPDAGEYPYEFTVINDKAINAFALPGGPIFVNSGLVESSDNEAQLAGVMAHEISHVALRHGTNQMSKANLLQIPAILAGAVIGQDSMLAQLGQLGIGLGLNALIMKYSRTAETQADALGARIMSSAGYNPVEMANFFEKLEAEGGSRAPQLLSSHPDPGNRQQAVVAEVSTLPARQYQTNSAQFSEMKQRAARLPAPRKRQQEAINRTAPASAPAPASFEPLRTDRFAMAKPASWRTYGDRRSQVLTIAPPEGIVRNAAGGSALGYGAVLSYFRPGQRDLTGATQELIGQLQQANPALQVSGGANAVNVGGSNGLIITLRGQSPYGGAERNVLLTVARPEGLFYMVFVAPESHFGQLQPAFQEMVNSLRF